MGKSLSLVVSHFPQPVRTKAKDAHKVRTPPTWNKHTLSAHYFYYYCPSSQSWQVAELPLEPMTVATKPGSLCSILSSFPAIFINMEKSKRPPPSTGREAWGMCPMRGLEKARAIKRKIPGVMGPGTARGKSQSNQNRPVSKAISLRKAYLARIGSNGHQGSGAKPTHVWRWPFAITTFWVYVLFHIYYFGARCSPWFWWLTMSKTWIILQL